MAVRQRPAAGAPGQHFLRSSRLAAELVADAGVAPGDLVVDVGAGTGAVTQALVEQGARVVALELDSRLAAELRRRFRHDEVAVVEADARRWAWPPESFSVVANLPFTGSGEVLGSLLRDPGSSLSRADLIVQWELAQKQAAVWPSTLRSVYWRAWFELTVVSRLSPAAFAPAPSVAAAVIRVERRTSSLMGVREHELYWRFLSEAFRSRRPLGRALRGRVSPKELRRLAAHHGFDATGYPRDLDARQWAHVYEFVRRSGRLRRANR